MWTSASLSPSSLLLFPPVHNVMCHFAMMFHTFYGRLANKCIGHCALPQLLRLSAGSQWDVQTKFLKNVLAVGWLLNFSRPLKTFLLFPTVVDARNKAAVHHPSKWQTDGSPPWERKISMTHQRPSLAELCRV